MRWMRSILAMLMVCFSLVVGLAPVQVASAASPYDTAYVTADSLVLRPFDAAQDCTLDVSTAWERLMSDPGNWGMYFLYEYLYPSFQDALISGSWGVSLGESEYENTTNVTATIFWNSTRGALLQWTEDAVTAPTTGYVSMQAGYNDYTDSCVVIIGMTAGSSGTVVVSGDTPDETRRNFLASYYDPNYPLDYEGETIQSEYRPAYVAMGDSFSSGEGNPPFEYSTDAGGTNENRCHRSPLSYPRLLQDDSSLDLGPTAFVACSGATTADVLYGDSAEGNWGEGPQVDVLSADTEVVTITVGGNDVGFSEVLTTCASSGGGLGWGCSTDTNLNNTLNDRLDALAGTGTATIGGRNIHSVSEILDAVHSAAPNAHIFIGGYPKLFGLSTVNYEADSAAPGGYKCAEFPTSFSYDDAQWMNTWANNINGVISGAVDEAVLDGINVTYVPPALFGGHGHCDSGVSYLYWVLVDGSFPVGTLPASFHPTEEGQSLGYELAFASMMD